ncbi:hypothetical protein Xcel_1207 [Xylanimonas cellulosilytica DSM 15894]|uniref:DUF4439 domain-containing protein n=1 Tax=Xylanimonas cellulosilytica (strain DSM 15894 / JCM 12276 / CECT 5975 / KCTC 9989 / LMG 20990 / NBRC 107835 / XIL07) TaxID=446471 RepID=D1C049_XYLCX|nr:DUF4439 domain-containing protein [Xylanimonas cellulosilytica]ACZ30238.1 hypothetical protein Xcel_1207 [Xylanimonas cellulosilytica DSM 15894]
MERQPAPTRPPRRRARTGLVSSIVMVLLVGVLSGCGVRLETPPPTEPVPDALEQVRRTAVADALGVAELATTAQRADGLAEPVIAELARVAADAHAHADALGGEYDSGLGLVDPDLDLPPSPSAVPAADPADVVSALSDAAGRSRTAASTTSSGDLARLIASVGAAQSVSAARLATLADVPAPPAVVPQMPVPGAASEEPAPTASPTDVATTSPGGEVPVLPSGLTASDFRALVLAEDGARYALEVRAARTSGDERARLLALSRVHGDRAQAWAELGSVAGTAQDPRRVAYVLPRDVDDAALVRTVQTGLATDYATLVGTTAPSTRALVVELLVEAAHTLDAWGAAPATFPGLPEQAAG